MAEDRRGLMLQDVRGLFDEGTVAGLSDGELLRRYITPGDRGAERAFAALVQRHGPMVLRVCSSILREPHDAHDAFQATFLMLVRRARTVWVRDSLGPWLQRVAHRSALRTRSAIARRRKHERKAAEDMPESQAGGGPIDEISAILHEEVARLPEANRAAVVLIHLEGLTQHQAARRLGWPIGTLQSRLDRGRQRLRSRLLRRGVAPLVIPVAAFAPGRADAVPAALAEAAIRAAGAVARAGSLTAEGVSASVTGIAKGVISTMPGIFLIRVSSMLLAIGVVAAGVGVLARQPAGDAPAVPPREFAMTSMPTYVVEPPDLLRIEVPEALPDMPITGDCLVRPDGRISLGAYGEVYVAGLTTSEIKEKVVVLLRKYLGDEELGLVVPDPGKPGKSRAVAPADTLRVQVAVSAFNSKRYYVLGEVAAPGKLPITGNETVLDAIQLVGGLLPTASAREIRVVRPRSPGQGREQILPVNLEAIVKTGDPSTNYQILPGDRLVIPRDEKAAAAREAPDAAAELATLSRRLDAIERRLDQVVTLLSGSSEAPPKPPAGDSVQAPKGK